MSSTKFLLPSSWFLLSCSPMKQMKKCPDCGGATVSEYEAPYQEYAGAKVWGGYTHHTCQVCGEVESVKAATGFEPRENTRGW